MKLHLFCVLKKWVHSKIGQYVRPAVYTITLHRLIGMSWNFVHMIVPWISWSSSKIRMIRQEMTELSRKLSILTRASLRVGGGTGIFQKKTFPRIIWNISIGLVFEADSEYNIRFELNCSFFSETLPKKISKCTRTASRNEAAWIYMYLRWLVVWGFPKCLIL